MGPGRDTRAKVKSAFPGRDTLIDLVYRSQPSFRDLCRDYRKCVEALERWRQLDGEAPSARTREYAELLRELSGEVEAWLAQSDPPRPPRSRTP